HEKHATQTAEMKAPPNVPITIRTIFITALRAPAQISNTEWTRLRQTIPDLLCREPSSWNEIVRQRYDRRRSFDHAFRQDPHLRDRNERHSHRPLTNTRQSFMK